MNEQFVAGRPPRKGNVVSVQSSITTLTSGRKVVASAGTAVPLVSAPIQVLRCTITAETDNTGAVVVGSSGVIASLATRTGVPLNPGDSYELEISDLSLAYIDSETSGDGVTFNYFT